MTASEYRLAVRSALDRFEMDLRSELGERLRIPPFWTEAALIEFIVHEEDLFRDTCPIYGWETDLGSRSSAFGGREKLQVLCNHILLPSELDYFSDLDFEPGDASEIVLDELAHWFAGAWALAGGREYFVPAYIMRHDALEFFSLNQRCWMPFPTDPASGMIIKERLK